MAPLSHSNLQDLKKITRLDRLRRVLISDYIHPLLKAKQDKESQLLLDQYIQILESKTLKRGHYYIDRLIKSQTEIKCRRENDINLNRWQSYDDLITDSLWWIDKRSKDGQHHAGYWGNFVPQIPNQLLRRFTKKGDWVIDPFLGSGTTLIECKQLGRNGIGIELEAPIFNQTRDRINAEDNPYNVSTSLTLGDSRTIDISSILNQNHIDQVQMIVMHPPYWDIISFSNQSANISNCDTLQGFLDAMSDITANLAPYLEKDRYLALVIGDKYSHGEWVPLGYLCMDVILQHQFKLKSIVVKNFEDTKAKRKEKELWRYRALAGGFYVFKHEYVFMFQKK